MRNYFRILQLNNTPDASNLLFESWGEISKRNLGSIRDLYEPVWEEYTEDDFHEVVKDEKLCNQYLERIFTDFNINRPMWFKGHSLSVSDVIEFGFNSEPGGFNSESGFERRFYYVDTVGFHEIAEMDF